MNAMASSAVWKKHFFGKNLKNSAVSKNRIYQPVRPLTEWNYDIGYKSSSKCAFLYQAALASLQELNRLKSGHEGGSRECRNCFDARCWQAEEIKRCISCMLWVVPEPSTGFVSRFERISFLHNGGSWNPSRKSFGVKVATAIWQLASTLAALNGQRLSAILSDWLRRWGPLSGSFFLNWPLPFKKVIKQQQVNRRLE